MPCWPGGRCSRSARSTLPIGVDVGLDYRVLAFALALSLGTGVAVGLAPALKATAIDLVPTLRDDGESRSSGRRWLTLKHALVVFQVAVSVVLLGVTSLFLQMLSTSRSRPVGFAVDGVAMLADRCALRGLLRPPRPTRLYEDVRRRVAAVPGVQPPVLTAGLPMQTSGVRLVVDGAPRHQGAGWRPEAIWAGPGFFDLLDIPVVVGRAFDERDRRDTPRVAVISETMARRHFGDVNAVGRRVRLEPATTEAWIEVIGVVRDTGTADRGSDLVDPSVDLLLPIVHAVGCATHHRAGSHRGEAARVSSGRCRQRCAPSMPSLPVLSAQTMAQHLEGSLGAVAAIATFLGALGGLGLCLAGIGLSAVVAFAVSRRSREIGIRMALGAQRQQVVANVTGDVAVLVAAGTVLGLDAVGARHPGAAARGRPHARHRAVPPGDRASGAPHDHRRHGPRGAGGGFLPARRAARLDPLVALRRG